MVLSDQMPVLVLPETTLFPASFLPAVITVPSHVKLLDDVLAGDRVLIISMRKPRCKRDIPEAIGCLGIPRIAVNADDGSIRAVFQGLARVTLDRRIITKPYPIYTYQILEPPPFDTDTVRSLLEKVCSLVEENLILGKLIPFGYKVSAQTLASAAGQEATKNLVAYLRAVDDPNQVADFISSTLLRRARHRQVLLQTLNLEARLKLLLKFLHSELRNKRRERNLPNELS